MSTTNYNANSINACFSTIDSSVTCSAIYGALNTADFAYSMAMSRIVINTALSAGTEFNNYVFVVPTENANLMNLALVNKDATGNHYDTVKQFPLYGWVFEKTTAGPYKYFGA